MWGAKRPGDFDRLIQVSTYFKYFVEGCQLWVCECSLPGWFSVPQGVMAQCPQVLSPPQCLPTLSFLSPFVITGHYYPSEVNSKVQECGRAR